MVETGQIARRYRRGFYWWLTLLLMLGLMLVRCYITHRATSYCCMLLVYAVSAVFWLIIVPTWLMAGWKVEQPLLLALIGWAVLIPTGLAMLDLRARLSPGGCWA